MTHANRKCVSPRGLDHDKHTHAVVRMPMRRIARCAHHSAHKCEPLEVRHPMCWRRALTYCTMHGAELMRLGTTNEACFSAHRSRRAARRTAPSTPGALLKSLLLSTLSRDVQLSAALGAHFSGQLGVHSFAHYMRLLSACDSAHCSAHAAQRTAQHRPVGTPLGACRVAHRSAHAGATQRSIYTARRTVRLMPHGTHRLAHRCKPL